MVSKLRPNINYLSDSFKIDEASSYHLLIQISFDEIVFLSKSSANNLIGLKVYNWLNSPSWHKSYDNLSLLLQDDSLWEKQIENVDVVYRDLNSNIVPSEFFDAAKLNLLFDLEKQDLENLSLKYDENKDLGFSLIYPVFNNIKSKIESDFNNANWINHASVFIDMTQKSSSLICVYVHDSYFELIIRDDNNLKIYNTFKFKTEKEFTYHLINSLNQFDLPMNSEIELFGKINFDSALFKSLKRYLPKINLKTKEVGEGDKFNSSYYYSIFDKIGL